MNDPVMTSIIIAGGVYCVVIAYTAISNRHSTSWIDRNIASIHEELAKIDMVMYEHFCVNENIRSRFWITNKTGIILNQCTIKTNAKSARLAKKLLLKLRDKELTKDEVLAKYNHRIHVDTCRDEY